MSSEINLVFPCFAPPEFPEDGRLILSEEQVNANYKNRSKRLRILIIDLVLRLGSGWALRAVRICILAYFLMGRGIMNIMTLIRLNHHTQRTQPNFIMQHIRTRMAMDTFVTIFRAWVLLFRRLERWITVAMVWHQLLAVKIELTGVIALG